MTERPTAITVFLPPEIVRNVQDMARAVNVPSIAVFLEGWITDWIGQGKPLPGLAAGYHVRKIPRGMIGHSSKILEEADEFRDAIEQGVALMALLELSDMLGAIKSFLAIHHPSITMDDLLTMSEITQRAFRNGHR